MHENRETSSSTAGVRGSPAGEEGIRTPGVHDGEESDGVTVPMNSSNKAQAEQAGAAEEGEGRTPTKENTGQGRTFPAQDLGGHPKWPNEGQLKSGQ